MGGNGTDGFKPLFQKIPESIRNCVKIHGVLPQASIGEIIRKAKVNYIASRWEGFRNASIEEPCCGCSCIKPINLAASSYLIENRSGTIASRRTCFNLVDAREEEAGAWDQGRRDPNLIAKCWKE